MIWSEVGAEYRRLFDAGRRTDARRPTGAAHRAEAGAGGRRVPDRRPALLYPVSRRPPRRAHRRDRDHAARDRLEPDPAHGYCVDDVARALRWTCSTARRSAGPAVAERAWRNLRFLATRSTGRRAVPQLPPRSTARGSTARRSEDSQGRAMLALGEAIADRARRADGRRRDVAVRPGAARRPAAARAARPGVGRCSAATPPSASAPTGATGRAYSSCWRDRLAERFRVAAASAWPWPEPLLTYENGLPVRALIVAGQLPRLDADDRRRARRSLDWLIDGQTAPRPGTCRRSATAGGRATASGRGSTSSRSRRPRSCSRPRRRFEATGDERYRAAMERRTPGSSARNDVGVAGRRSGARRLLRRADAGWRQHQPGRRVDADVAHRRWSTSARCACRATPRAVAASRACAGSARRRIDAVTRMTRAAMLFDAIRGEPDPDRRRRPLSRELGLQPGRGAGRRRDDPAGPRRGPARHLAAPRRAQHGRRHRIGASIPSRCCAPTSSEHPEEIWGCEDPRLTWLPEREEWAIAYTAYSRRGPLVSLAMTRDFRSVARLGPVMPPEDKDAALFPRRFDGRWAMIHRPSPLRGGAHMWISYSPDLRHWGDHSLLLEARDGAWWDAGKIGLGPPPLETAEGWLVMYHGVHLTGDGPIYRVGLALLDLDDPRVLLRRIGRVGLRPDRAVRADRRRRQGRLPVRLGARRGDRPAAPLLRRGGHVDRRGDGHVQRGPRAGHGGAGPGVGFRGRASHAPPIHPRLATPAPAITVTTRTLWPVRGPGGPGTGRSCRLHARFRARPSTTTLRSGPSDPPNRNGIGHSGLPVVVVPCRQGRDRTHRIP